MHMLFWNCKKLEFIYLSGYSAQKPHGKYHVEFILPSAILKYFDPYICPKGTD